LHPETFLAFFRLSHRVRGGDIDQAFDYGIDGSWPGSSADRAKLATMRRLSYFIILSADGMYAEPDGGLSGFEPDEEGHRFANHLMNIAGDLVISRGMYDVMTYWDDLDPDDPNLPDVEREFARFWKETPKHVVTRGDPQLRENAEVIHGDAVQAVRAMKDGDGRDIMLGSGAEFLADLAEADLIDEYRLVIVPMALGHGKSLFAELERPLKLKLTGTRTFPNGSVMLEYVPDRRAEPTR
jgi:dihydrofolate reductase